MEKAFSTRLYIWRQVKDALAVKIGVLCVLVEKSNDWAEEQGKASRQSKFMWVAEHSRRGLYGGLHQKFSTAL